MTLDTLIMLAGAIVAVLPFLGFPNSVDAILFVILGALVISLGIVVRRRDRSEKHEPYVKREQFEEHYAEDASAEHALEHDRA